MGVAVPLSILMVAVALTGTAVFVVGLVMALVYLGATRQWERFRSYFGWFIAAVVMFGGSWFARDFLKSSFGDRYKSEAMWLGHLMSAPFFLMFLPEPLRRARKHGHYRRSTTTTSSRGSRSR